METETFILSNISFSGPDWHTTFVFGLEMHKG